MQLSRILQNCWKNTNTPQQSECFTGEGDEPSQPRLLQLQQLDLICESGGLVEFRAIQNALDVLEWKFQLAK